MKTRIWALPFIILLAACQPQANPSVPPTIEASAIPPRTAQTATILPATDIALPAVYQSIQVAYTDQGQVWFWADGQARSLTSANTDTPLVFSARGKQIAFIRDGELLAIHSDGSGERVLLPAQDLGILTPQNPARLVDFSWLPNKPLLLVSTLDNSGIGLQPNQDVYLLHADTGELIPIFPAGQGGIAHPSPDGNWLAVVSQEEIILMKSDGSGQRTVLTYAPYQSGYFPYIPKPYWAVDSRLLLLEIRTEAAGTIWRIPVEGDPSAAFETASARGLSFSPDLSMYAYILDSGVLDSPIELHIAATDGASDTVYARASHEDYTGLGFLGWAPDSKSLLYKDTAGNILWMKVGKGDAQEVPTPTIEPFRAMKIVWLDEKQFLIVIRSPSGIWLCAPEQQSLQIAGFTEEESVSSNLARSFDVVLIDAP